MMKTREAYLKDIEAIDQKIEKLQDEIRTLEDRMDDLYSERQDIENEIEKIQLVGQTTRMLQEIQNMTDDECKVVTLYSDTRTTPIMDYFQKSDKKYLIFKNIFTLYPAKFKASLIVTKARWDVYSFHSNLTMTNLKQMSGARISEEKLKAAKEGDRKIPLYKELIPICKRKKLSTGDIIPFKYPCRIGGQTYADQTGFGWEYCGEDVVSEGREYGETTDFFVVGVIIENQTLW